MATFADLWNQEAVAPSLAGIFDQQGANASYAFLEPMAGGSTVTVPTQTYQPTPVQAFTVTPQTAAGAANNAAPVTPASSNCAWYDVVCHGSNAVSSVGNAVTGVVGNAVSAVTGPIESYFIRGVIILLGFIFVAVGLAMFNQKSIVNIATTAAKVIK